MRNEKTHLQNHATISRSNNNSCIGMAMNKRGAETYKDQFTPWVDRAIKGGLAHKVNEIIKRMMEQSK